MRPRLPLLVVLGSLVVVGCGGSSQVDPAGSAGEARPDAAAIDGSWILASAEIDGQSVASDLFLDVNGTVITADTLCGAFGLDLTGAPVAIEEQTCDEEGPPDLEDNEEAFVAALTRGPMLEGDLLVFADDGVQLTYRRAVDVSPEDLFAALEDETMAADPSEIAVDPEAGPPLEPSLHLARLDHPSTAGASFYVGRDADLVCTLITSEDASLRSCRQARDVALGAFVFDLWARDGDRRIVRAALIPDAFVAAAAAQLSAIGEASGNVLVVDADAAPGDYAVTNDAGDTYVFTVPG